MNLMVADDEMDTLQHLVCILEEIFPEDVTKGFRHPEEAKNYAKHLMEQEDTLEFAFLDIEMPGMSGLELAGQLKDFFPGVKIIFVTEHEKYAFAAFRLHARGYLLKPVSKEMIEEELQNIEGFSKEEREKRRQKQKHIVVKTFGNFDVFVENEPLKFSRSKARELFAFLVDKKGTGVNTAEISSVLWEDKIYDRNLRSQTQTVISQMIRNLKAAGVEDCIIKKWNYLAIVPERIECDYYHFLAGDEMAIQNYTGEYMSNYSWAEFTAAFLDESLQNRRK